MRADIFDQYWQAITAVEAQQTLRELTVADYPHLQKESRKKIHKGLYGAGYPGMSMGKSVTPDQFFGKPRVKDGQ